MAWDGEFRRIDNCRWEIPRGTVPGMLTNAVVYASEGMLPKIREDNAPLQAANVACLPGIVGSSMAMPDNNNPANNTGKTAVHIHPAFCPSEAPRLRRKAYSRVRPRNTEV